MTIRDFRKEDIPLLRNWLIQDHIRKFWGDPEEWISEISENIDADWVRYFIVENPHPIGFLQYYETDKAPAGDWSAEPAGTVGIDYLIGDREFLGKGYGSKLIQLFVHHIQHLNRYSVIIADPVRENMSSVKVLVNNGFELHKNGFYKLKIR